MANTPKEIETITAAAIKIGEQVHSAGSHLKVMELLDTKDPYWSDSPDTIQDGFLTNTGRFVERAEAVAIAKAAGQATDAHPDIYLESENF